MTGQAAVRIFDSKPDIAKMFATGDVENLARIIENGSQYFDHDENTRVEAVGALGSLADQRAIDPLIGALHDDDERVHLSAVAALNKHHAFYPLVNALHVRDSGVRTAAAEVIGELAKPLAVLPLTKALDDEDARVRAASVEALVKLGESSTDPLIHTLRVTNNKARRAAAEALGQLGDPRAVLPLIAALKDQDWRVSFAAACAQAVQRSALVKVVHRSWEAERPSDGLPLKPSDNSATPKR